MSEISIEVIPAPPELGNVHVRHYCSDPGATLKLEGDLLVISRQEGTSAQLIEVRWGPDGPISATVCDLSADRYARYVDEPLVLEALVNALEASVHVRPLKQTARLILAALAGASPHPVTQEHVMSVTSLSERCVRTWLTELRSMGLAYRPCGEKGGDAVTTAGMRAYQSLT